jgi:subtilisin family serine protease
VSERRGSNGQGIDGIAPNARLLVAGVGGGDSPSSFDPDSMCMRSDGRPTDMRASSTSRLSGLGPVAGYREAVDYALAHGALVVAAAGNFTQAAAMAA